MFLCVLSLFVLIILNLSKVNLDYEYEVLKELPNIVSAQQMVLMIIASLHRPLLLITLILLIAL